MNAASGGHVIVRGRAIERTFAAVAAAALRVAPRDVSVRIADDDGLLRVDVRGAYAGGATSVVDAARHAQEAVRRDGADLTGTEIRSVRVRITDITTPRGRNLA